MPLKQRKKISELLEIKYKKFSDMNEVQMRSALEDAAYYSFQRKKSISIAIQDRHEQNKNYPTPEAFRAGTGREFYKGTEKEISEQARKDFSEYKEKLKTMDLSRLRHEFVQYRNFLATKTSTITGWERVVNTIISKISKYSGVQIKKSEYKYFWDIVNTLGEGFEATSGSNYEVYRLVGDAMKDRSYSGLSAEEFATKLQNDIRNSKMKGEGNNNNDETANLFPLGKN